MKITIEFTPREMQGLRATDPRDMSALQEILGRLFRHIVPEVKATHDDPIN